MFSVDRIYAKLSQLRWPRLVSGNGCVTLGHYKYYVGWAFKGKEIEVCFDPQSKEFIFCSSDKGEVKRWPIKGINFEKIVKEQDLSPNK
ncbi:MAG: hypothetical protein L6Q94_22140 [Calditrichia bacterium]|nr:hypothetical protein [Calditrichia bacterium]